MTETDNEMYVLALQGSPHRGNTFDRVEQFGEILTQKGDVEFEHLELKDMDIAPCRGCFLCFYKGEDVCPLDDDRKIIEEKMEKADAVVFATPVYSMHVSYLLKTLIDRMAYIFHRPRFFQKYAAGIAVAGSIGQKPTLKYIEEVAESWGFDYIGGVPHTDPPGIMNIPGTGAGKGADENTVKSAEKMYSNLKQNTEAYVGFKRSLNFHVMRNVYKRMEKYSPEDFRYWKEKGWLEPGVRYFIEDANTGFFRNLYGKAMGWFVGRMIDREFVKMEQK